MLTYKDLDINNGVLSITESKENPRFLDILNNCDLNDGDEITITIEFKTKHPHRLQFNRSIIDIKDKEKEVINSNKEKDILITKDFILQ